MEIDEGYGSEKVVLCQSRVIARYFARRFGEWKSQSHDDVIK